ncbi:hypothetical protein ACNRWW_14310 [Metabacillus sp. HB246100]
MRFTKLSFISLLIFLVSTGCTPSHQQEDDQNQLSEEDNSTLHTEKESHDLQEVIKPISLDEMEFHSVAGWKNNQEILYITNNASGAAVSTYQIFNGQSDLFFQSEHPIVQVVANADQSLFLIHTSPSSYEAELIFINQNGEVVYETSVVSTELNYTWNHMVTSQLFVSSFNEDWTYHTYVIDAKKNSIVKDSIAVPFIQWIDETSYTTIEWDDSTPSLTAPLYQYNGQNQQEALVANEVVANTNYEGYITSIELGNEEGEAAVRFYSSDSLQQVGEMPTRLVSLYSDWSIPYHDLDVKNDIFYLLEVNIEKTSFSLVSFNIENKEKRTVLENIDNLPIRLSPKGDYALYGARLEKVIKLEDDRMEDLIIFK